MSKTNRSAAIGLETAAKPARCDWRSHAVTAHLHRVWGSVKMRPVKYALGIPPFAVVDKSHLTSIQFTNGTWELIYEWPAGVTDVVYDPQTSADLLSWTNGEMVQQFLGTDTNSLQVWGANYNGSNGPTRFYQLRLHQ